jgi:cytidylate kinase
MTEPIQPPSTIAIDGPAASGKSTIGYYLACHLNYLYLDTGILYRAATWAALERKLPIEDEAAVTALAEALVIDVLPPTVADGRQYTVRVWGRDITWALRAPEVEHAVSPVSAYPGVRDALTRQMREIGRRGKVVMVGRDIGTVVLPDADMKLYVVASAEIRAQRRLLDRQAQGDATTYEAMLADICRRDAIDSGRDAAPLRPAEDAIIFDNTHMTKEAMFDAVMQLVEKHLGKPEPVRR